MGLYYFKALGAFYLKILSHMFHLAIIGIYSRNIWEFIVCLLVGFIYIHIAMLVMYDAICVFID
jgi:hypothetical protein